MSPTENEQKGMTTLKNVFSYAGFDDAQLADDKSVPGSLLALIGAKADVKPVNRGIMKEAKLDIMEDRFLQLHQGCQHLLR